MKTCELTVTRVIPAAPEAVFDVWIDPKSPGGPWFGAHRVILDARVDGLFYLALGHEARIYPHYGRFVRIERPGLVEHTWMSEGTRGLESVVTVTMRASGDGTEVTLRQANVPDDEEGRKHEEGWGSALAALAERFERGKR